MSTPNTAPAAATAAEAGCGVLLDERDPAGLLEAARAGLAARRAAEVDEMRIAAQWAVLHGHPRQDRDPMVEPGGEGTPPVREYALPELALARETHYATTRALLADTLDLIHRLPATWAKVTALGCEPWVARKVAVLSRTVPVATVGIVDAAVAAAITGHAPATVLEIAAAKVIEADPETHAMRREYQRHRRYATLSRSDEFGYRLLIARITAGDAAWLDAMLDRVADILTPTHGHDHNRDELRSLALGWLARPADLLQLLLDHTTPDPADDPATDPAARPAPTEPTDHHDPAYPDPVEPEPTEPTEEPEPPADSATGDRGDPAPGLLDPPEPPAAEATDPDPEPVRPAWAPDHLDHTIARLAAMTPRQLAALRGKAQVFVHLHQDALRTQAGIARIEGHGPILVQALAELLGHADIRLTPVIDLALRTRVDAYEHPTSLKDQVWLLTGGDVFPYTPRTATRSHIDFDHPTPYQPDGPAGQTGTHNSAPLRRRHHRWKTHGGYRSRPAGPGRYLWQTPHGDCYLRDHTGTHRLPQPHADAILTAPPGLDLYPADFHLQLAYQPGLGEPAGA